MSAKKKLLLNADGLVSNEGVHDASIIDVNVNGVGDKMSALILCKAEDGTKISFSLKGLRLFSMEFYGPQNVINDVLVVSKTDASSELKEFKDLEKFTFEKYDKLNKAILKGELSFVRLIPSVGAEIIALCKDVDFRVG